MFFISLLLQSQNLIIQVAEVIYQLKQNAIPVYYYYLLS
jgi:hypothetical protein